MKETPCAIALGSNLGDSLSILQGAIATLSQTPGITLQRCSRWYKTEPVGPPQPHYLNGCALLNVQYTPLDLLDILLGIERQFGRVRRERWGPRTLDLDILLFGDLVLNTPRLTLPHPHMNERAFVLIPLVEIAPEWVHPIQQQTILTLQKQVNCEGIILPGKER